MGNFKKTLRNTAIGLLTVGSLYGQNEKIDSNSISTKKELIENFKNNKNTIKIDKETETIMSFASNLDCEAMKDLGKKYEYTGFDSLKTQEQDSILYTTMKELNQKYGNPKITIKRFKNVEKIPGYTLEGRYSIPKNIIYINPELIKKDNGQSEIVSIWLSELSHSKQFQKGGLVWRLIKDVRTLRRVGGDYMKLYDKKGTIEHEAHTIIEPALINEFVESYINKIDTNNTQEIAKAENIFDLYDDTQKQIDKMNKKLQFISKNLSQKEEQRSLELDKEMEKINREMIELLKQLNESVEDNRKLLELNIKAAKELEKSLLDQKIPK